MRSIRIHSSSLFLLVVLQLTPVVESLAGDPIRISDIPQTEIISIVADADHLYAASYSEIYHSTDRGDTWHSVALLPDEAGSINTLFVHEDILYVGSSQSGVYASKDRGDSWLTYDAGLSGNAKHVLNFIVRGDSLFAGTNGAGIYVLNLQDPTEWSSFNQGLQAGGIMALATSGSTLVASGGTTGRVFVRPIHASSWTAVPLDDQDPQNQVVEFLPVAPYLLAGASNGILRSPTSAGSWQPVESSLPPTSDVKALTRYGARIFAGVVHEGTFIYSSDDFGDSWTKRSQEPMPVYDLFAGHGRLWVGRADGLWYYDLVSTPRLVQATLLGENQGEPVKKGSLLATWEDNVLSLLGFFSGLDVPWIKIDLYRGDPLSTGERVKNISLAVPEGGGPEGRIEAEIALSENEWLDLMNEQLYLHIRTLGNRSSDIIGQLLILPIKDPTMLESPMTFFRSGSFARSGMVRAVLEGNNLRLLGAGNVDDPVYQITLNRGALGDTGEHLATFYLNYTGNQESSFGFDHVLPLSDGHRQDLLEGLLYLEVLTAGAGKVQGRLFPNPNEAPAAALITSPTDGTTILVGGAQDTDPMNPDSPLFEVTFTPADDPEGSPVACVWQISSTENFETATVSFDLGPDSTFFSMTAAEAAVLFDSLSGQEPGHVQPGTSQTVYHRVLTTDGSLYTFGQTYSLNLVRGRITGSESEGDVPAEFTLHGNYPNPFNPSTTVSFDLPVRADVRLEVFDLLGRQVYAVQAGILSAGVRHKIEFDGGTLPSGSYLFRVIMEGESSTHIATGKMTLIK